MQIDQIIQEKLIRIPEKIFEVFSNHLEQEILNYLYHYKISLLNVMGLKSCMYIYTALYLNAAVALRER